MRIRLSSRGERRMTGTIAASDIHYETRGTGAPIAILGGPWLGHAYLRGMDPLADAHRVVYHDARGTGRTPAGRHTPLTIRTEIDDLESLRERLGLRRWSVVAHSFGAHVAMLYAGMHPERIASLVLANAGPPLSEELMKPFFSEMMSRRSPEDMQEMQTLEGSGAYARHETSAIERSFRLTYRPFFDSREAADALDLGFTEITAKNAPGTEMRLFQELQALDPIANLGRIRCPTLVVHAERDPIPEASSRFLADRIPGAAFALLPSANHFAFLEAPTTFFGIVKPFLARNAK